MNQRLAYITLIVDDYDRAIEFYTGKLNFQLVEDSKKNNHCHRTSGRTVWQRIYY